MFDRLRRGADPLPPIVLDENIRNTKQIAQVFGSLGAEQARYRGMDGPPVRFVQCTPEEAFIRLIPRSTGSSARAGNRDRSRCW